jgi:hypothetical protein
VFEFRELKKGSVLAVQGFGESDSGKYYPKRSERCGDLFANPEGLTLRRRKNTEIPLLLKSNSQAGFDGIPLKGEESIKRYGQEKNAAHRFNPASVRANSIWRRLGQRTPYAAIRRKAFVISNKHTTFEAATKTDIWNDFFRSPI